MADSPSFACRSGRTWFGYPGQAANVNGFLWVLSRRCVLARHGRAIRELEFGLHTLHALEQARCLGRGFRDTGQPWAARRHGACHRLHGCAGAPTWNWRKWGNQNQKAISRSRGGFSIKIHFRTNAKGDPPTFDGTSGEAHEIKGHGALMELHDVNPDDLLSDKGYDIAEIRDDLMDRAVEVVIPPRSNRKTPIEYDREAYKPRNLVQRCNRLKQFRRIATRYEKTTRA